MEHHNSDPCRFWQAELETVFPSTAEIEEIQHSNQPETPAGPGRRERQRLRTDQELERDLRHFLLARDAWRAATEARRARLTESERQAEDEAKAERKAKLPELLKEAEEELKAAREAKARKQAEREGRKWHSEPVEDTTDGTPDQESSQEQPEHAKPDQKDDPTGPTGSASKFFNSTEDERTRKQKRQEEKATARSQKKAQNESSKEKARREKKARKAQEERERKQAEEERLAEERRARRWQKAASEERYRTVYQTWSAACTSFFNGTTTEFPRPPSVGCSKSRCIRGDQLDICHHELMAVLKGSDSFSRDWIKQLRLRFHPDRFSRRGPQCQELAKQLFCLFQAILEE